MAVETQAQLQARWAGLPVITNVVAGQNIIDTMFSISQNVLAPTFPSASYTFLIADASRFVFMNVATANNLTIPPNVFVVGQFLNFAWFGVGQTTILPGAGVTIVPAGTITLRVRYSPGWAYQTSTNNWLVAGDLT